MKNKKLNLDALHVSSFRTDAGKHTRGGAITRKTCGSTLIECISLAQNCQPSVFIACLSQGAQICSDDSC